MTEQTTVTADASRLLLQIGRRTFRREQLAAQMDAEVAAVRARYVPRIETLNGQVDALDRELAEMCATARGDICGAGRKSAHLAYGTVSWRANPPAVRLLRGTDPEQAARRLRDMGYPALVREALEPNLPVIKDALTAGTVTVIELKGAGVQVRLGEEVFSYKLDRTAIQTALEE